jgi:hypothetical protein
VIVTGAENPPPSANILFLGGCAYSFHATRKITRCDAGLGFPGFPANWADCRPVRCSAARQP